MNAFVFAAIGYLLNCQSLTGPSFSLGLFSNRWLWLGVGLMVALQLLFTYSPLMNRLFNSTPLGGVDWLNILAFALLAHLVVELEKWASRLGYFLARSSQDREHSKRERSMLAIENSGDGRAKL